MKAITSFLQRHADYHLVVLRIGLGLFMFVTWGMSKISAGPALWEKLGGAMGTYGITFLPVFWGFMAAFAESIAALLIVLGLFTRYSAFLLGFTMLTIIISRHTGDIATWSWGEFATPFHILLICIVLMLTGAGGRWNLEKKLFGKEH